MSNNPAPTVVTVARLRAESLVSEPTIKKWLADPSSVQPALAARLEGAAQAIGFTRTAPKPQR